MTTGLTCMLRSGVRVGASGPVVVARLRVRACARGRRPMSVCGVVRPAVPPPGLLLYHRTAVRGSALCGSLCDEMWRPVATRWRSALTVRALSALMARPGRADGPRAGGLGRHGAAGWVSGAWGCSIGRCVVPGGADPLLPCGAPAVVPQVVSSGSDATGRAGARSRHIAGDVRRTTSMS